MNKLIGILLCGFISLTASDQDIQSKFESWATTGDFGRPYSTLINSRDIDNSTAESGTMRTISTSGRYYLSEDIQINPINASVSCLKITTSNVVLDFRGHSLSSLQTGSIESTIGVEIASGISNVSIINGTISAIRGTGIKINPGCDNIKIHDMHVSNCTLVGITASTSRDIMISNCSATRCDGSHASASDGAVGLRMDMCGLTRVFNSHFDNNQHDSDGDTAGIYLTNCKTIMFDNCTASLNLAGAANGDACSGIKISSCSEVQLNSCIADANESQDGVANGYAIDDSPNVCFYGCKASGNIGAGADSHGFSLSSGSSGMLLENCESIGNISDNDSYGFKLDSSNYSSMKNCKAIHQETEGEDTSAYGFYVTSSNGNSFEGCAAISNTGGSGSSAKGAGFCLSGGGNYHIIMRCKSKANTGNGGIGYGVWLESATYCTIAENEICVNTGGTNGYGIKDDASSSVSAFMKNFAYGNGKSDGLILNNYDVALSPNDSASNFPVWEATLADFSAVKNASTLDNVELIEKADVSGL